jgi:hypothetical protein
MSGAGLTISKGALRARIRAEVAKAGTADAWCRRRGIPPTYLSDVLNSRRPISDRLLAAIGVRREEVFVLVNPAADATDPVGVIATLSRQARRTLLWLHADGTARDRGVRDGEWRPSRAELMELRTVLLTEEVPGGDALNPAGMAARAALVARNGGSESP